jgi:diadenosine tetraphosphate (Ap4A) HIT family hydrolase
MTTMQMTATAITPGEKPVHVRKGNRPLFEGEHWAVYLYRNQSYLGRSVVYLKNRRIDDPLELTDDERDELWVDILPKLTRALNAAFQPDRINYAHLANRLHHVHWHVVPRYEKNRRREFAGRTFVDKRQGKIFRSKRLKLPRSVLDEICAHVKSHLD